MGALKIIDVRKIGRKRNKKFVALAENVKVKIRIDAKTMITCSVNAVERWKAKHPDLQIL